MLIKQFKNVLKKLIVCFWLRDLLFTYASLNLLNLILLCVISGDTKYSGIKDTVVHEITVYRQKLCKKI